MTDVGRANATAPTASDHPPHEVVAQLAVFDRIG